MPSKKPPSSDDPNEPEKRKRRRDPAGYGWLKTFGKALSKNRYAVGTAFNPKYKTTTPKT